MDFKKPKRRVTRVFLHCSASDHPNHDDVSVMDAWHRARGWSGVGYHFFIKKDGTIQKGRDIERTPAAQAGHNSATIAICLHGLDVKKFTEAQFDAGRRLCFAIDEAYGGKVTFHGHREVAAKACPVFDYRDVLQLDGKGRLGWKPADKKAKPATVETPELPPAPSGADYGTDAVFVRSGYPLRRWPSYADNVVAMLEPGDQVDLMRSGTYTNGNETAVWHLVAIAGGREGWLHSAYLDA